MNDAVLRPNQDPNSEAEIFANEVVTRMSGFTQVQKRTIVGIIHSCTREDLVRLIERRNSEIEDIESDIKDLTGILASY
jgi:hypothetical protein